MSRQHDAHCEAEALAMCPDALAELVAGADAEAADHAAYMLDMAGRDAELGPWPSDEEVAEYEATLRTQRRA